MADDNYFDSEKAFHEAVDPGRRSFLKKMLSLGAGVAVASKLKAVEPVSPPQEQPVSAPPEVPRVTSGYAQVDQYSDNIAYYTCASSMMMTCDINYWEDYNAAVHDRREVRLSQEPRRVKRR